MMLQPVAAKIVRDRQQEIVMIVMLGAESLHRLFDQALVRSDLLRRCRELRVVVADDVERDVAG